MRSIERGYEIKKRTNNALPEDVGLAFCGSGTGEFPIDLVLDVAHGDERSDDTSPATGLDCADNPGLADQSSDKS